MEGETARLLTDLNMGYSIADVIHSILYSHEIGFQGLGQCTGGIC